MSREELSNFIRAAEHSSALRRKIQACKNNQSLIDLAKEYRFSISLKDFNEDNNLEKINNWFQQSKIRPIKHKKI